jgi:hypothetical protein
LIAIRNSIIILRYYRSLIFLQQKLKILHFTATTQLISKGILIAIRN